MTSQTTQQTNLQELVTELAKLKTPKGDPLISDDMLHLISEGLHHALMPDTLKPKAAEAFQLAFEAIGGLPRLAVWADRYPASFYKLFARQTIPTIAPNLPAPEQAVTEQWPPWLTARRLAYQEEVAARESQEDNDGPE